MALDFMALALDAMAGYGLVAVFLLLLIDGMGLPAVPAEVILIVAVAEYATDNSGLLLIIALAVSATMLGAIIVYAAGRWATRPRGPNRTRRPVLGMSPKRQEKMERIFSKPAGRSSVFFLRLFPFTRVIVSLPAGMARMRFWPFVWLSTLGTLIFFVAFLWLAYEFRDPDSGVASAASSLEGAYVSPAFQFAEANAVIMVVALLVLGIVLSVRASIKMARDPDEGTGSMMGTLATGGLFWGGVAILAGLWVDPQLVLRTLERGGLHPSAVSVGLPYDPLPTLGLAAALAILVAVGIHRVRTKARATYREKRAEKEAQERAVAEAARIEQERQALLAAERERQLEEEQKRLGKRLRQVEREARRRRRRN